MSKKLKQVYEKQVKEIAHSKVVNVYKDAMQVTDGVYYDILREMRNEIDVILKYSEK